ncbi:TlpA family protein disulfide reductase [Pseudaminobacter sp. 19-2017]|uniref:TlpA family protein disulfide reductase n=1 Tax=Pseudaminobacter soli (ex Zhang et al. 2022) TaxID=2831468 RepID=A0A942I740_9HYPH|nr:TlpA disulfide reductase family protein [Pseudaminobacter soli]MBS3647990.1 TlpA family protein disulfide reductase [Pseudaminobacter soli]
MTDRKEKRLFPAWRAVMLAMVAGVFAGAVGVYVTGGFSGNNAASTRPGGTLAGATPDQSQNPIAADDTCPAKADHAKTLADAAVGQVAAMLPADPPQSLKTLAFHDPAGKPMTLADRADKTILLNLWATWCAPCRAEMPSLDALQKEKGNDRFEVIAVNVDTGDDTKPKKFLEETKVGALGYYRDNTLDLFNDLKKRGLALGLPVTLLIDGEGCLLAHMNGPAEWASDDAKHLIEAAIAD